MRSRTRRTSWRTAGAVLAGATLAGCGTAPPGAVGSGPAGGTAAPEPAFVAEGDVVQGVGTVLESPEHGPQLCFAVATSAPPQCGGPDIVGWDWEAVRHESAQGVRWTDAVAVVGRWEGGRLVLTEPPAEPTALPVGEDDPDDEFATPCPEPQGGWRPIDAARATDEVLGEVQETLGGDPEFAGLWIDQGYLRDDLPPEELEQEANDPRRYVLNVRSTGELGAYEERIRELWGGALCVSSAEHSLAELEAAAEEVPDVVPRDLLTGWGADVRANRVEVSVVVLTEDVHREVRERFGPDVVTLRGDLQPQG